MAVSKNLAPFFVIYSKKKTKHRRSLIQHSVVTFGALSLTNKNFFQMLSDHAWKITMLTDSIGVFTERGGTIGFHISKEGITVVDAQFPDTARHLIAELKKKDEILTTTEIPGSPQWTGDVIQRPLQAAFEELSL